MARPVTAADVAARAGVSRATVSYVLNDTPGQTISPSTSEAVRRAAAELDYRPNHFARSLKRGRGGAVLCPLPGAEIATVIADGLDACASALAAAGLTLLTDFTRYADADERTQALLRLQPAAVIDLFVVEDDPAIEPLRATGAVVLTTSAAGESAGDHIASTARLTQVDHVLDRGHRRIVVAGEPASDPVAVRRLVQRMRRRATQRGATLRRIPAALDGAGVASVVAALGDADAVCASSDDFGVALVGALGAVGVRVPEDVAVIGVDDRPIASACTPPLTTVAAGWRPWGAALADAVIRGLEGAPVGELPALETWVVERATA